MALQSSVMGGTFPRDAPVSVRPSARVAVEGSASADLAGRLHHEKLSLHVGVDIAPESILHGLTFRTVSLGKVQRRGLPRVHMERFDAFLLHFDGIAFFADLHIFEEAGAESVRHGMVCDQRRTAAMSRRLILIV